jgi:hypothetical protein
MRINKYFIFNKWQNYGEDFDDDFEPESEEEKPKPTPSSSSKSKKYSDDEDDYKSSKHKSGGSKKYSDEEDDNYRVKNRSSNHRSKYDNDRDDDYSRGTVVKANAMVKLPTELVEVHSSKVYYNHDSVDRQKRRAKDLFKNMIELDSKSFSLLDINPAQMRTVYSSHLRHVIFFYSIFCETAIYMLRFRF